MTLENYTVHVANEPIPSKLSYRLHEWDEKAARATPSRLVCLRCGLDIERIKQDGIQCVEGRPTA